MRSALWLAALALLSCGNQQPAPTAAPSPSAAPTSAPSAAPSPTPAPSPSPTGPVYRYTYTPPRQPATPVPGAPKILEIDFTDQTIHQNSDVALRILTTPAVSAVVLSAMGHQAPVPQVQPGVWAEQMHIPSIPFFLLRTYNVEVRAATADGRADTVTLPVRLVR